ncbi:MAG: hypothetical protein ACI97A_002928 [Planctomycetota bacterium]|jgi:hypothetical protein
MQVSKSLSIHGDLDTVREGVRAYFLGEGYEEDRCVDIELQFSKPGVWQGVFGYRIEQVGANVTIDLMPHETDANGPIVVLAIRYDVKTRFRLLSRLDGLYFELELEALVRYLDTGMRPSVAGRLDDIRTPIAITAMSNTILTGALVATAGLLIQVELSTVLPIVFGVSLINFVSIVGFADIVVDGMDRLGKTRTR